MNMTKTIELIAQDADYETIRTSFENEIKDCILCVQKIASSEDFLKAVMLSNFEFYMFFPKHLNGNSRNSKFWQTFRTVVMYLQRFCAKNDTNSFFGSVSWGTLTNSATNLEYSTRAHHKLQAFFAYWAAEAIADSVSSLDSIKPHLTDILVYLELLRW